MPAIENLPDSALKDKIVLLRADLNVPVKNGDICDTTRIDRLKPTIDRLHKAGAKTLILSHFGRPKGEIKQEFSLSFLPQKLSQMWGYKVGFCQDITGDHAKKAAEETPSGDFLLLENIRFRKGEEQNDEQFAQDLAALGDIYVNDAFSASHRSHASIVGIPKYLPSYTGYLMREELDALSGALETPERPLIAIIGGAKISTKLNLLGNLSKKADAIILGGGMANTFLYAQGYKIGASLCEKDMAGQALEICKKAEAAQCRIYLPADAVCAQELTRDVKTRQCDISDIPDHMMMLDIGPKSASDICDILDTAKTAIWNGPLGAFETSPFDTGTSKIARHLAKLTQDGQLVSIAGGGDTLSAIEKSGISGKLSYVSTAGGAFLEWMEGKTLPGVAAVAGSKK